MLPRCPAAAAPWVDQCDVIHLRVPIARRDLRVSRRRCAAQAGVPAGGRRLRGAAAALAVSRHQEACCSARYVAFEEWALRYMTARALTFANGAALRAKHERDGARVIETKTTTLSLADISTRTDTCSGRQIRLLTRQPDRSAQRPASSARGGRAMLAAAGHDVTLDIVGPTIGLIGETERDAIASEARGVGVADRVSLRGAGRARSADAALSRVRPLRAADPARRRHSARADSKRWPRVTDGDDRCCRYLEPDTNGANGLLSPEGSTDWMVAALRTLMTTPQLRQQVIRRAATPRRAAYTLERQAASLMEMCRRERNAACRFATRPGS